MVDGHRSDAWVKRDSITDLNATIAAYAGERLIRMPKGTWTITEGTEPHILSNTKLLGSGPLTILSNDRTHAEGGHYGAMMVNSEHNTANVQENIEIGNIYFEGNGHDHSYGGFGLQMENINHSYFHDLWFHDIEADCMHINGTGPENVDAAGPKVTGTGVSADILVERVHSDTSGVDGFAFDSVTGLRIDTLTATLFGSHAPSPAGHGLTLTKCHDGQVRGVVVSAGVNEDAGSSPFHSTGVMWNGSYRMIADVVSFSNHGCGLYMDSSGTAPEYNIIKAVVYANTHDGAYIKNADYCNFDITSQDNALIGINLPAGTSQSVFKVICEGNTGIGISDNDNNVWIGCSGNNGGADTIGASSHNYLHW